MAKHPMYRQIADIIRKKISDGEYKVGKALPTEAQLRKEFTVSRVTVRQALKILIKNNEINSIQGSGSFVTAGNTSSNAYLQADFDDQWTRLNITMPTHSDIIAFEVTLPNIITAEHLNITDNQRILYTKRVYFLNKNPISVEETWMPLSLFPDLTHDVIQHSKYDYIENQKGLIIDRNELDIIPILPSKKIALLLNIHPSQPIVEKRTLSYLFDGTVFEYSRHYLKSPDCKFALVTKRHRD